MLIKVSEAFGPALDWMVAKCEGNLPLSYDDWVQVWPHYSTDWAQGGRIIEREGISLLYLYVTDDPFRWAATQRPTMKNVKPDAVYGPTLLIAAMRCYVASKLGGEVDTPDELSTNQESDP